MKTKPSMPSSWAIDRAGVPKRSTMRAAGRGLTAAMEERRKGKEAVIMEMIMSQMGAFGSREDKE